MIESLANKIPSSLFNRSGSVFYSGRDAFKSKSPLYVLGLNPGGNPDIQSQETVSKHTVKVLNDMPDNWSAYRDESWRDTQPGRTGMQPRVLHLLNRLSLDPGIVPSSNVVFLRSARERDIKNEYQSLAELCWPFHQAAIEQLEPKAILCFGLMAGGFVRKKLEAHQQVDEFVEMNRRRWNSRAFSNNRGQLVVVATHPSIADWTTQPADPSEMIQRILKF